MQPGSRPDPGWCGRIPALAVLEYPGDEQEAETKEAEEKELEVHRIHERVGCILEPQSEEDNKDDREAGLERRDLRSALFEFQHMWLSAAEYNEVL